MVLVGLVLVEYGGSDGGGGEGGGMGLAVIAIAVGLGSIEAVQWIYCSAG